MKRYLSDNKTPEMLSTQPLIYTERPAPKYTAKDWALIAVYVLAIIALGYSVGLAA